MRGIAIAALFGLGGAVSGQQATAVADLRELLVPIRARHEMPALGAAVIVGGELAALGVDGVRRAGHDEAVTVDDLWHLGSCTKAMTATLLARFVERGALAWTTTLADALPSLADGMHADHRASTLQHLLAHRAGLPGSPPRELWRKLWEWRGALPDARLELAATMLRETPELPRGEKFVYGNPNYIVAGAILERVAKTSWEDAMRGELFAPLGITSGGFGAPGARGKLDQPWGHERRERGGEAKQGDNPPALGPAGTVHMTLRDWVKFVTVHLDVPTATAAATAPKPLLRPETLAMLHTLPFGGDYGFGWHVTRRPWASGPVLTHNGSNTMWFAVAWLSPADDFAVLVTCNHGDGAKACDEVAGACIGRFRPVKK